MFINLIVGVAITKSSLVIDQIFDLVTITPNRCVHLITIEMDRTRLRAMPERQNPSYACYTFSYVPSMYIVDVEHNNYNYFSSI